MNSRFSCHICSVGEMGDNQCRNCATSTEGLQPGKPEEEGDILTKGIQGTAGKGRGRQECGKVDLAVLQLKSPDVMSCEEIKHCLLFDEGPLTCWMSVLRVPSLAGCQF